MSTCGTQPLDHAVKLMLVPDRRLTIRELIETIRSIHGDIYIRFGDRMLRGADPQAPTHVWCRRTRAWMANLDGPVPDDVLVTLLTEPQAEREMWPEFYTWADQWL